MIFSVQPSVNKRNSKMPNFFHFLIDDVIDDVMYLMNLGNKYRVSQRKVPTFETS